MDDETSNFDQRKSSFCYSLEEEPGKKFQQQREEKKSFIIALRKNHCRSERLHSLAIIFDN